MSDDMKTIEDQLKILESDPQTGHAHLVLGRIYLRRGEYAVAQLHLEKALECRLTHGETEEAHYHLGEVARGQGRLDAAVASFESALKINPSSVWAHIELGDIHTRNRSYPPAQEHLQRALDLSPDSKAAEAAHFRFGEFYKAQDKLEDAARHFLTALKMNPSSFWARVDLGNLYRLKGMYQEAEEQLLQARRLIETPDPGRSEAAHLRLGEVFRDQHRTDEAISEFRQAIEQNPSSVPALAELGDLHRSKGSFDEADRYLRQALAIVPKGSAAEGLHHRLGEAYAAKGDLDSASDEFLEVLRINPSSVSAHMELGDIYRRKGQFEAAEEQLGQALGLAPTGKKAEFAHFRMGELYRGLHRFDEAVTQFQRVFKLNPDHGLAMIELAKLYRERRMFAEAEESLRAALKTSLDPDTAKWAHVELATIYQHTGRPISESIVEYEEASKVVPSDKALRSWLDQPRQVKGFRSELPPYRPHFTWNILSACNYGCSYCSAPTTLNKMDERDKQTHTVPNEKWLEIWKDIYDRYGTSRIRLSGGEPSLYKGFHEVVGGVSQWHIIQLNTNLSFDVKKFVEMANPKMVRIDASFHPEYPRMEGFLEKIRLLRERGFRMIVSVVASPAFMEHLAEFKRRIEVLGSNFLIHPFYGPYNGKTYPAAYTEEEKKLIYGLHEQAKVNLEFQTEGAFHTKGRLCRMGQMYATVFPNGEVFRCCNNDYRLKLGNVTDGTFRLLDEPTACEAAVCQCWRSMVVEDEKRWAWQWVDDWEVYAESNPFIPEKVPAPAQKA